MRKYYNNPMGVKLRTSPRPLSHYRDPPYLLTPPIRHGNMVPRGLKRAPNTRKGVTLSVFAFTRGGRASRTSLRLAPPLISYSASYLPPCTALPRPFYCCLLGSHLVYCCMIFSFLSFLVIFKQTIFINTRQ